MTNNAYGLCLKAFSANLVSMNWRCLVGFAGESGLVTSNHSRTSQHRTHILHIRVAKRFSFLFFARCTTLSFIISLFVVVSWYSNYYPTV